MELPSLKAAVNITPSGVCPGTYEKFPSIHPANMSSVPVLSNTLINNLKSGIILENPYDGTMGQRGGQTPPHGVPSL